MLLRMSSLFLRTLREDPADAEVPSHRLLVRAGYVRRVAPGIFSWLPLGWHVYRNVERIVREEMDAAGFQEVHFPALLFVIPSGHDWRVTLALVFVFGVVDLVSVINVINFRQEETPEDMMSRVNTTGRMLSWGLGAPAGALLGGVVGHALGPGAGMAVSSVVVVIGVALGWASALGRIPARRELVPDTA